MSDTSSKRLTDRSSLMMETVAKRRCLHEIKDEESKIHGMLRHTEPLSNPWLPDDIWRVVFQYLDVGHICTRMALLNRNWSRACWRVVSAYVPGEPRSGARPAQFKYRPTGFMSQLVNLPVPQYLRTLTLDSVKLTEAEVRPIYQFSGLVSLQLVVVRGRAFQNLSRLISLRSLTTWNCEWVNSDVLMQIGCLERLEHLTLNCCDQISDEGLRHLSTLTNLMSLGLTDLTVISEVGLRHLSTLTNLETLTLAFNPVSDDMVRVIAEHHTEKLQVLDLDASSLGEGRITDAGLVALGKLTKLRRLKLGYHSFTPAGLASLSSLTNLESLSLESVEGCVTGDSLRSLSKLVHLRKLNLDSCPTFDDNAMAALIHFTELEHLNIAKTMFKRGLSSLSSETHPRLAYLDISFSEKLDDEGLKSITRLQNLTALHLFRCPKGHLTTKGTRSLLALKRLELLDCRECPIAKDVARTLRTRIKDFRQDLAISAINLHNNLDDVNVAESEEFPDSGDEADMTSQLSTNSSTTTSDPSSLPPPPHPPPHDIIPIPHHLIVPIHHSSISSMSPNQSNQIIIEPNDGPLLDLPIEALGDFGSFGSEMDSTAIMTNGGGSSGIQPLMVRKEAVMYFNGTSSASGVVSPFQDMHSLERTYDPLNQHIANQTEEIQSRLQDDMKNYRFGSGGATDDSDFESEEFEELGDDTDDEDDQDEIRTRRRTTMDVDEEEGHQEADDRNLLAALRSQRSRPMNSSQASNLPISANITPRISGIDGHHTFDVEELDD